jgi:hypothetical protein
MLRNLPITAVLFTTLFGYAHGTWAADEKCGDQNGILELPLEFVSTTPTPPIPAEIPEGSTQLFQYTVTNNSNNFDMTILPSIVYPTTPTEPDDVTLVPSATNDCSDGLAFGHSCNITVQIQPTEPGLLTATLHVNYDNSCFQDITSPISYTAAPSAGFAYITNSTSAKAGSNVQVCNQVSTADATNGELLNCVDSTQTFSQPSGISLAYLGVDATEYALVTNYALDGGVDVCAIADDGTFSSCENYPLSINNAYGILSVYDRGASTTFAYITNGAAVTADDSNVVACTVNTDGTLGDCPSAFLPAAPLAAVTQIQTINDVTYNYITNYSTSSDDTTYVGTVTVCVIDPVTSLLENCFDSEWGNIFDNPYGIAFRTDPDTADGDPVPVLYAYVADPLSTDNTIFICSMNSANGSFENCTQDNTDFVTPSDIAFYSALGREGEVDYIFVTEQAPNPQTTEVAICTMNDDSTGTWSCVDEVSNSLTPINSTPQSYAYYYGGLTSGNYVYLANYAGVLQCLIDETSPIGQPGDTYCINAFGPGGVVPAIIGLDEPSIQSIAFNLNGGDGNLYAYLTTPQEIFMCEVNTHTGLLDPTSCTQGGPTAMNNMVSVAFATIGSTPYAYVADSDYETIFVCDVLQADTVDPDYALGRICNCTSADDNNSTSYGQLAALTSVYVGDDAFVYAVDSTSDTDGVVWQCTPDPDNNGIFTDSCINSGASALNTPIDINVYSSTAYILNSAEDGTSSYSLTECTIAATGSIGQFTDCAAQDVDNTLLNSAPSSFAVVPVGTELYAYYTYPDADDEVSYLLACPDLTGSDPDASCFNPLGVPYSIVLQADTPNDWAYITNVGGVSGVLQCAVEPLGPSLSNCADSGTEYMFTAPYGMALQNYGDNAYAYIVDAGAISAAPPIAPSITQCEFVSMSGGLLTDCATIAVPSVTLETPMDISFNTVGDVVYAYITDQGTTDVLPNVYICTVNTGETPPTFSSCQNTNVPHFNQPLAVDYISTGDGQGVGLYIPDAETGRIGFCSVDSSIDSTGLIERCIDTGYGAAYSGPSGVTLFAPDTPNPDVCSGSFTGSFVYVANTDANTVQMCPIDSGGGFCGECTDSGLGAAFSAPISVAFSVVGDDDVEFAYVTNSGNNTVSQCPVNADGTFAPCDSTGSGFVAPTGIALTNND